MPTIARIRQLCAQVVKAKDAELQATLAELANALELFEQSKKNSGDKSEAATLKHAGAGEAAHYADRSKKPTLDCHVLMWVEGRVTS